VHGRFGGAWRAARSTAHVICCGSVVHQARLHAPRTSGTASRATPGACSRARRRRRERLRDPFFVGRFWYLLVASQLLLAPWSVDEHAGHVAEGKQTPRLLPACAYRRGCRGRARGAGGPGEPVSALCLGSSATAHTGTLLPIPARYGLSG
jgi:hypothetical protein